MDDPEKFVAVPVPSSRRVSRQRLIGECIHKIIQTVLGTRVLWNDAEERAISKTFNFEMEEIVLVRNALADQLQSSLNGDVSSPVHIDICVASASGRLVLYTIFHAKPSQALRPFISQFSGYAFTFDFEFVCVDVMVSLFS